MQWTRGDSVRFSSKVSSLQNRRLDELDQHGSSPPRALSLVRDMDPVRLCSVAEWREVWEAMKLTDRLLPQVHGRSPEG